jgi:hypothetical protein
VTQTLTTHATNDDHPEQVAASAAWLASTLTGEPVDETTAHAEQVAAFLRTLVPPAPDFLPCPDWCQTCYGGDRITFPTADGRPAHSIVTGRLHERTLYDERLPHGDLTHATVGARIRLDRCDEPGQVVEATRITVELDGPAGLTPAQGRALAAALVEAAALMDAETTPGVPDVVA